jgi:hypothetical protein
MAFIKRDSVIGLQDNLQLHSFKSFKANLYQSYQYNMWRIFNTLNKVKTCEIRHVMSEYKIYLILI